MCIISNEELGWYMNDSDPDALFPSHFRSAFLVFSPLVGVVSSITNTLKHVDRIWLIRLLLFVVFVSVLNCCTRL